jgi:phosphate transport system permease protein
MNDLPTTPGVSRPPTGPELFGDRFFRGLTFAFAWLTILLVAFIVYQLASTAAPTVQKEGTAPLTGTQWDAGRGRFGFLPHIFGTLYSSVLGVALGGLFGVAVAIVLTEGFLPAAVTLVLKNIIELLAAIPSVVYGLWGIFVVIPAIRGGCNWLHEHMSWFPPFSTPLRGPGLLPAALVLAIMVLPTVTAISRDAIASVPIKLREAAYGLGATRWETILGVVLPTASRGIYGSILLAFGRALGETMALAMLVGNATFQGWSLGDPKSWSIFEPANTLAALLANQFPEAGRVEVSALMYAALVLLAITLAVNVLGTLVLRRTTKLQGAH